MLCGIALGDVFYVITWKSGLYALLCALVSAVVFASFTAFLSPLGVPALTAPFVLSTWLFLLPKGNFLADQLREGLFASPVADLKLSITWSVTVDTDIAAGIIRVAEQGEDAEGTGVVDSSQVIAMATLGYSRLQQWVMGSITLRVLHATRLPLLIVRPPDKTTKGQQI